MTIIERPVTPRSESLNESGPAGRDAGSRDISSAGAKFRTPANRPLVVKAFAFVAVLFTIWHIFASFLWIFPPSPLRQLAPGESLTSYMLPLFGQSWTVFAPEPINGDYHFNVRALVTDEGGQEIETEWVSANEVELSMVINNLFPPRAGAQSEELASNYLDAWRGLNAEQREVVAEDFLENQWQLALTNDLESLGLPAENSTEDVQNPAVVTGFLYRERQASAYATQVAKAMWGDGVEEVQYRISRQDVVPFGERNSSSAVRPDPTILLPGWREAYVVEGQDEAAFAEVFQRQYERLSGVKVER
ncbi:hypothetical protein EDF62_3026 [Leucobacter luti]|uniref:Uncharacterized protein n=1 Tax=Leucobacter luti TaxID=340320 RepID=A0A4R6RS86_9MICO|nr:DUF5819 family protein [Leucobacter luti]TDP89729.1 hypothetical protein EDF62_3026 [Leucobacter luti]